MARWDGYSAVILAATVAVTVAASPGALTAGPAGGKAAGAGALLAMAPWYLLAGRPAMTGADRDPGRTASRAAAWWRNWRGEVYLAGLAVLLTVAVRATEPTAYILLALCPQCFMAVPYRRAVVAVMVLNAIPAALVIAQHGSAQHVLAALAVAAGAAAFSVVFGAWITGIIRQSSERATLIAQLESTRAELADLHREAGMQAERQRLSAEIHDTIAQGFASIVMLVQAAEASVRSDPDNACAHLNLAAQTARENLAEARALVAGLAPVQLDGGSLDDALRRVTAQAAEQAGFAAGVEIAGPPRPLPVSAQVVLLRVCQEALANAARHAGASRARVGLCYGDADVRLEVGDDGAGFDPGAVTSGYGLRGMRARVAEAGGELSVRSAPGQGATVRVTVRA
jgi:signal transduction histidine kinase